MEIILNNNKCKIEGDLRLRNFLYKKYAIKHPNAYFLRRHMQKGWDGKVHYITEASYFGTGFLPMIVQDIIDEGHDVQIIDNRLPIPDSIIPKQVGNHILRGERRYQALAIKSIVKRKVAGEYFPFGTLKAATNAGKTTMAAGIWLAYKKEAKAIVLINDGDLYEQFKTEIPQLVGAENFGFVRGKKANWNDFTICMAQTLAKNIDRYKHQLIKYEICVVDEADLADNKTYKSVIQHLSNTWCRVGMSGSIYESKLKKHLMGNMNLMKFFSGVTFEITKQEMIEKGLSADLDITFYEGYRGNFKANDYDEDYDVSIIQNKDRNRKVIKRIKANVSEGQVPILVTTRYKRHCEGLHARVAKKFPGFTTEFIHSGVKDKDRKRIIKDFRDGKIQILVATLLIKRGKNFPLLRCIINAASGDSEEGIIQLMGRGERLGENKSVTRYEDFFDDGRYLKRHSNHRIRYMKKQGFEVKLKF